MSSKSPFDDDPMSLFNKGKDANDMMEVLRIFYDPKHNDMLTEINNPPAVAKLVALARACRKVGFTDTYHTIKNHLKTRNIFMVSYKREGRKEGVDIAKAIVNQDKPELTLGEKLISKEKNP